MSYKLKYIAWKQKYLNKKKSDDDDDSDKEKEKDTDTTTCSEKNKKNPEEQKTEPGRGVLGDAMYYWIANTKINKPKNYVQKWTYKDPEVQTIQPELVPYTEFNQETLQILYPHLRPDYDEGFDVGYIVGYECGCNNDKTDEKRNPPGNISNPDFLKGFFDGFNLGFYKGGKYYYTTLIQINNNNIEFKRSLINYVSNPEDNPEDNIKRSDPNYDPIEERQFNEYYVYLKKKLLGKTHWFI
jgi:hypothetical protein